MKKLLFIIMMLVLAVVLALTIGVQMAFAMPEENGPVKFRGTVASDEQCDVFPVCYEECFCPVNLTEIIDDPYDLLKDTSSIDVCYGHEPMDLKEGETVEVYGFCWYGGCPLQLCGRVHVFSGNPDYPFYIIRLPAPTPTPRTVVSGQSVGGGTVLPYAEWGDIGNDWGEWVPPGPPPGFEECDEFQPCEWVWVWGYEFEYYQTYRIWIQPYGEDPCSVVEGQELLEGLCPPGSPPENPELLDPLPDGWEPGWVDVHIDEDGKFGPVPIWHVQGQLYTPWEIVADKMNVYPEDDYNEGFYNEAEDGLDAIAYEEWGFHIYPEGLTIILVSLGLAGIGGYCVVRRRKGTNTAS